MSRLVLLILLAAIMTACQPSSSGAPPAVGNTGAGVVLSASQPTPALAAPTSPALPTPTTPPPASTATPVPTHTPAPSATPPPVATAPAPSPAPGSSLRRLTEGGCCVSPSWLPDSRRIIFIDKPEGGKVGLYAVDTEAASPPTFFADRLGYYGAGYSLLWQPVGETIRIERLSDKQVFTLRNGGRTITLSPDGAQAAWQVTPQQTAVPLEQRTSQIWVANIDGTGSRSVANLLRGGLSGWFPDGKRMLVSSRPDPKSQAIALSVLDLADGSLTEVVRAERLRGGSVSPDGRWILYSIAFHPDPALNGQWLVRTDGSERRKLDFYAATQWRGHSRFIYIPLDPTMTWHTLYEYDAETGISRRLTDPAVTPFKITNGDWVLSPDGAKVIFVSAQDRNLWLLTLP